ncbi:MAG: hypothetical protein GYB67_02675 [Chloroflexi bacterium]|nr:hypothetical protein [Chloroflexota bacterium]
MAEQAVDQQVTPGSEQASTAASTRGSITLTNLQKALLIVARLALAYLFFSSLWWKVPPTFGCPEDYAFSSGQLSSGGTFVSFDNRTSGLCDWLGIQHAYATVGPDWLVFVTNLDNTGDPEIFLNLTPLRQFNGAIVGDIIMPNIQLFGWLIWLAELSIVILVGLGLFSRVGGLIALGVSLQLTVGLAGIRNPAEFEWIYLNMVFLSLVIIAMAPGRFLGIDALLIPRLTRAEANGSRLASIGLLFTGR